MSDELNELKRQMEQATAPRFEAGGELESETASLRAGWLALEELLVAAEAQIEPPMCSVPFVPTSRRRRRMFRRLVALAALLLVAVTLISYLAGRKQTASELAKTKPVPAPARHEPVIARKTATPEPSPGKKTPAAPNKAELAWNDSFDQEFESVGWAIQRAQMDQFAFASKSDELEYQLEGLRKEIEDSSL